MLHPVVKVLLLLGELRLQWLLTRLLLPLLLLLLHISWQLLRWHRVRAQSAAAVGHGEAVHHLHADGLQLGRLGRRQLMLMLLLLLLHCRMQRCACSLSCTQQRQGQRRRYAGRRHCFAGLGSRLSSCMHPSR